MNGQQCDTCRTFTPGGNPPPGWLVLFRQVPASGSPFAALLGQAPPDAPVSELAGTWCCERCLADWLLVRIATEGIQGPPGGAGGWVG